MLEDAASVEPPLSITRAIQTEYPPTNPNTWGLKNYLFNRLQSARQTISQSSRTRSSQEEYDVHVYTHTTFQEIAIQYNIVQFSSLIIGYRNAREPDFEQVVADSETIFALIVPSFRAVWQAYGGHQCWERDFAEMFSLIFPLAWH